MITLAVVETLVVTMEGDASQQKQCKDHYCYVYSALLQMVQAMIIGRKMECVCKRNHTQKFAKVLQDIRSANYMLFWVVSSIYIYMD